MRLQNTTAARLSVNTTTSSTALHTSLDSPCSHAQSFLISSHSMSRSAIDIMALQPNARAIIDMVDEVSDIGIGRTDLKSWRSFSCTTAEYAQVYHYLRQPGKEDLYDCFNTIR